ncbi:MAG: 4-hydroxyphenylpyruvate dioxygenase, partial [Acidimicrobiales bacterium]
MTIVEPKPTTAVPAPRSLLRGWDSLEFWVGNARTFAGFFCSAFGFRVTAYAGPETGVRDRASYVLEQGRIRFVVSGALGPDSPIAAHVRRHGDGVHDVTLAVSDATAAFDAAVARGAVGLAVPHTLEDEHGLVHRATVATYGETCHTFVDRSGYHGAYLPGFTTEGLPPVPVGRPVGLDRIDHVVGNLEKGRLEHWVEFYRTVFGFERLRHFDDSQISTKYSALMSSVMWDGSEIVLPLNEPAYGLRKSQIQEYLDTYNGPGVQHIALRTDDIVTAVASLRERGLRFLVAPPTYYADVRARLAHLDLPWDDIERLGILVDEEPDGWLLQIFTENLSDRPTVFVEI